MKGNDISQFALFCDYLISSILHLVGGISHDCLVRMEFKSDKIHASLSLRSAHGCSPC